MSYPDQPDTGFVKFVAVISGVVMLLSLLLAGIGVPLIHKHFDAKYDACIEGAKVLYNYDSCRLRRGMDAQASDMYNEIAAYGFTGSIVFFVLMVGMHFIGCFLPVEIRWK